MWKLVTLPATPPFWEILFEVARIGKGHPGVKLGDTEWNLRGPGEPLRARPGYIVDNLD